MLEGIGIINAVNCVALEIVDDKIKIIKSNSNRNAYKISYKNNEFAEEILNGSEI